MQNKIVIVGGGTSGWMAAAYFAKALQNTKITVVESEKIRTIGVGEATFSTIKLFFDFLGISERQWMSHCNGTYKLAIKFKNWTQKGGYFYHPFQRLEVVDGFTLGDWWLRQQEARQSPGFDAACFTNAHLCDNLRSPRFLDGRVYQDEVQSFFGSGTPPNNTLTNHMVQYPYGYHFDAALVADYLRKYSIGLGVLHVQDDVTNVQLDDKGWISQLKLAKFGSIQGDLYVDCTGFRGLLINKALNEPFCNYNDYLLNDKAVALQVPYESEGANIEPYTSAIALSAGWMWNIPLYNRRGTGYVYCSNFISPDKAEEEIRRYLGPSARDCSPNHIDMRIGRTRNSWVKNCVAIGLASGFIEPLESTGIFIIQHGIEEIVRHFPWGGFDPIAMKNYNRVIAECIDGLRDFLFLHYWCSDRTDTAYWAATKKLKVPESLTDRLQLWKRRLPDVKSINQQYHGFEAYSYAVMLLGLNYCPDGPLPVLDLIDSQRALEAFERVQKQAKYLTRELPSHREYLAHLYGNASDSHRVQPLRA